MKKTSADIKKIQEALEEYETWAYNTDCAEGLTGFRALGQDKHAEILEMPTKKALAEIKKIEQAVFGDQHRNISL